jgi:ankyrin repeat protein
MKAITIGILVGLLSSVCHGKGVEIHGAAREGDLTRVKKHLANNTALISGRDGAGRTPLTVAAIGGQKEVVLFLLSQGADVNDKGFMEMTPLADMAAGWGQRDDERCTEIAEVLLSHGALVNAIDGYGTTPLYRGAESGRTQLVRLLLEKGADTSLADKWGKTALHVAAMNGRRNVVEILVNAKAWLDVKDRGGLTPLKAAEACGQFGIAKFLKAIGAPE